VYWTDKSKGRSHGDIVVDISGGQAHMSGGNVSHSVTGKKHALLNGYLSGGRDFFAVLRRK